MLIGARDLRRKVFGPALSTAVHYFPTTRQATSRRSIAALLAATTALIAIEAVAAIDLDDPFADLAALHDNALADMRGGFTTPSGVEIDFGVTVQTFVDGSLALQSVMLANTVTTTVGNGNGLALGHAHAPGINGETTVTVDGASPPATDGTPQPIPLTEGTQVEITANGGLTRVVQDISQDHITTLIENEANETSIHQVTTLDINIDDTFGTLSQTAITPVLNSIDSALIDSLAD